MANSEFKKFMCITCKQINYRRRRASSKGVQKEKIETDKFCKHCREHTTHKETK